MFTLNELTARLGGEVVGDGTTAVGRIMPLDKAEEGDLAFLANAKYVAKLGQSKASAVIVPAASPDLLKGRSGILAEDSYLYFARAAQLFNPPPEAVAGIHPSAVVESEVPPSVEIGACARVGANVTLGEGVIVGAGSHVGKGSQIGAGTRLAPNVTIYPDCVVGERCVIHAGAVIGAEGFGFAREKDGAWVKIPQTGGIVIGNDVEIGANTTIDRGALDDTVIADGVKLDNLIQIAHNVQIGRHTAIAGSSGIAGSAIIGERCMLGGQTGVSGHLRITDDVVVYGCTMVNKSIRSPGAYTGQLPIQKHADWVRNFSHLRHLDEMAKKIRALEKTNEQDENAPD